MLSIKPSIIQLKKILDDRGNLSLFENEEELSFEIKRVHWIYDVPGGEKRGGLAYKTTHEFVVAMSGSFDVVVDDGNGKHVFPLNRSYMGVYIPAGAWRSLENFSTNSLALIAASTKYAPDDAIRDYDEFIKYTTNPISEVNSEAAQNYYKKYELKKNTVSDCDIINLDRHHSKRKGDICVVENEETVPFNVKRVYYLYDVPGGASRGGHAHKNLYQLIVAASGCFTVNLDDGTNTNSVTLNRPYQGLLVKPGIWRTLDNFSSGSVCMVLASEKYDPEDYIRDYNDFIEYRNK